MLTIYHNPRCSKSRQTLEIIRESGIEPKVVEYLGTPLGGARILQLASLLGVPVAAILRRGEDEFKSATDLPDMSDDSALAVWIAKHPKVLERPIVVDDAAGRAVIGRPPENVLGLIRG
jgi:arsenate reductase